MSARPSGRSRPSVFSRLSEIPCLLTTCSRNYKHKRERLPSSNTRGGPGGNALGVEIKISFQKGGALYHHRSHTQCVCMHPAWSVTAVLNASCAPEEPRPRPVPHRPWHLVVAAAARRVGLVRAMGSGGGGGARRAGRKAGGAMPVSSSAWPATCAPVSRQLRPALHIEVELVEGL